LARRLLVLWFVFRILLKRAKAPTPKFFKVLRNIGLVFAGVEGTILAAPIALPVVLGSIGGYLAVAGGVLSAISQITTIHDDYLSPTVGISPSTAPRMKTQGGKE
jgi:hypothetical protein